MQFEEYRILELAVKAKPLFWSRHDSHLSDLGGVWSNAPTMQQRQPRGFKFDLSVDYQYEMLWFEPYVSYTKISATEWDDFSFGPNWRGKPLFSGRIQEPANITTEFGINIGIRF